MFLKDSMFLCGYRDIMKPTAIRSAHPVSKRLGPEGTGNSDPVRKGKVQVDTN
jgi:hypothetical protein